MEEPTRNINRLTFSHQMKVYEALKEVIDVRGKGEFVRYRDDWSDAKVAASMPFPCTAPNVAGIRRQEFGELTPGGTSRPTVSTLMVEIRDLTDKIANIETRLAEVENIITGDGK